MLAGGEVGRGQAEGGELRAVGAAADHIDDGLHPGRPRGRHRERHRPRLTVEALAHVAVLRRDGDVDRGAGMPPPQVGGDRVEEPGLRGEGRRVEVAQEQPRLGPRDAPFDVVGMHEALAAGGRLGGEPVGGERGEKLAEDPRGVHHPSLADARMDVDAADRDDGEVGGERLGVDRAPAGAVEGVAADGADPRHVEVPRAAADLLVAGEDEPDRPVGHLPAVHEPGGGRHDHRHARLVVGAEQRRAVRRDDRAADEPGQLGVVGDADHPRGVGGEHDVAAAVIAVHDRLHGGAARLGGGVDVGHPGDRGGLRRRVGGHGGHDDAVRRELHVGEAEVAALALEQPAEVELLGGARARGRPLVGLGVDADVGEEAVEQRGHGGS